MIIYKAINKINNKGYIGRTIKSLEYRKTAHIKSALRGSKVYFHSALRKYGIDNFEWSIIDVAINEEELNKKEIEYIKLNNFNNSKKGYNLSAGGKGISGYKLSKETKRKISEAHKGKKLSEVTKQKLSTLYKNKTYDEIHGKDNADKLKEKLSNSHKGRTSPMKGKKHSEETKIKISIANIGKKYSIESINKMKKAHLGKIISIEQREKLRQANLGKRHSEKTKIKMKNSHKLTKRIKVIQFDKNGKYIKRYNSVREACLENKVLQSNVSNCCLGKRKTTGGFGWKYE